MTERRCAPCADDAVPLAPDAASCLLQQLAGWSFVEGEKIIERRYRFPDFAAALAFVNQVGALAESEGHHPDFSFGWGYVTLSLHTHSIGGLHENDFILAARIDALNASR
ncbi:4a-hydroxytetrahydrobiopterin dehydratase [Acetobacter nitrogenifigens]|uniref:4a-hydroxytetrahydrobiopterin dehydratase n=1 Tax=Acetobacter nitrogenifigens TaxID=285268 RepID=UPI001B7FA1C7|nr:4a-hydroxytetrahydrobiopterin dehydratase [Acetobacter nitrogenifigens]